MFSFNLDSPRSALTACVTPFVVFPVLGIVVQLPMRLSFPKVIGSRVAQMTSSIERRRIEYISSPLQRLSTVDTL